MNGTGALRSTPEGLERDEIDARLHRMDQATLRPGHPVFEPRHPVDVLADMGADPAALAHARIVTDEQVAADGRGTGLVEYPGAVSGALLQLVAGFCVGIMDARPPNQQIGRTGSPYLDRWYLARKAFVPENSGPPDFADLNVLMPSELENLYLHAYHRGDADEPHDHPWPNASLVVRGWYRENVHTLDGQLLATVTRRPGDIVLRSAQAIHAILETSDDCLSLFATLPKERDWGFWTADGFVPWRQFDG